MFYCQGPQLGVSGRLLSMWAELVTCVQLLCEMEGQSRLSNLNACIQHV